jgi:HAD superfamily hydrolase (TIGR01450 family)
MLAHRRPGSITTVPALVCDLDGVVWLARRPIPGAARAIARLRDGGWRVLFVTNNSYPRPSEVEAWLDDIGVPAAGDVRTSAMAAGRLLARGERVLALAGPGVQDAVMASGADLVDGPPADAVVVGFHQNFDYAGLRRASTAVRTGARLIGTNDDATYPTPDGPIPGGGAILAAVATASGAEPTIAGKPHEPMVELVRADVDDEGDVVVVGDRASTDGLFARAMKARFALVLSGVTTSAAAVDPRPDLVADDLAGVADQLL